MAEDNPTPAQAQPATLAQSLGSLSSRQYISLIVAGAAIIALVVGLWMWGQTPDYRVLYSNLSDRDGGAIIEVLQQQNIPYKFSEGGGSLMVPADKVHEIRLRLASQGLPKGSLAGFELMENEKFGTSQFLEQVNYQRALEGELARSIQTLAAVQSARVHLALPKPSVFVKEQLKPSASVVLTLYPGRTLDAGQINGIIHLISSSVADMPAKNVTVLDQSGLMLSPTKENPDMPLDPNQIQYVRQIEQDYAKRIEAIVTPLVGAGNVHAQITADIDFSQSEQTAETFGPNQPPNEAAVRSKQSMEESRGGTAQPPAWVPGALSNQPPIPATAPIVTPASAVQEAATAGSSGSHKESTTNYEVDRTIRYTKLPVGSIKRLSVAVIVNNRTVADKAGKTTTRPLTDDEKEQITALVKGAMGFNSNRGDALNVLNSAFSEEKAAATGPELPLWQRPEVIAMAKDVLKYLIIAGIGLYLVFGIIRPAIRNFENGRKRAEERLADEHRKAMERHAMTAQEETPLDYNMQSVKQLAQNDPKVVAAVIKDWVTKDE